METRLVLQMEKWLFALRGLLRNRCKTRSGKIITMNQTLTKPLMKATAFRAFPIAVVFLSCSLGLRASNFSLRSGSAYVVVPDSSSLDSTTNELTVECWFSRVTNPNDWNALLSRDPYSFVSSDYELRFIGNSPVATLHLNPPAPAVDYE